MPELNHHSVLYAPSLTVIPRERWSIFVDAEAPNWVSTDERGTWLLQVAAESPMRFTDLVGIPGIPVPRDETHTHYV